MQLLLLLAEGGATVSEDFAWKLLGGLATVCGLGIGWLAREYIKRGKTLARQHRRIEELLIASTQYRKASGEEATMSGLDTETAIRQNVNWMNEKTLNLSSGDYGDELASIIRDARKHP